MRITSYSEEFLCISSCCSLYLPDFDSTGFVFGWKKVYAKFFVLFGSSREPVRNAYIRGQRSHLLLFFFLFFFFEKCVLFLRFELLDGEPS